MLCDEKMKVITELLEVFAKEEITVVRPLTLVQCMHIVSF
jgi:hypothetical protein